MLVSKNGRSIESVDDWFRLAPPRLRERHWVDGRSAKELAKSFFESGSPVTPPELVPLLSSSPVLGVVHITEAWPEHKIRLDSLPGDTRNADLACVAFGKQGTVAITVEAKADESFGPTVARALALASNSSKVPQRITTLAKAVLGCSPGEIGQLRYQLLHGVAASLILAGEQNASAAVFAVFEFTGPSCSSRNIQRNGSDLNAFIQALSPGSASLVPGQLTGSFLVPGGGLVPHGIPLFIGKARRQVR